MLGCTPLRQRISDPRRFHVASSAYQISLPHIAPDPVAARVFHDSSEGSWSAQGAWKFCSRCYGLFYGPHNADGDGQAGGVHREYPDYHYQLP